MNIKQLVIIGAVLALSACVTTDTPGSKAASGGKWVNLGVSVDGNILHELDKSSIKRNGALVTFKDKKTIENTDKEHFLNLPVHKMQINYWEINCRAKTYRLVSTNLFNKKGERLFEKTYTAKEVAPMRIVRGSATEKQQQIVCQ